MTADLRVEVATRTDDPTLRTVERWALVSGVTGCVANGLLVALWAVAIPGNPSYDWTGPANDVVGAVSTAAVIPVVLGLPALLGRPRGLTMLSGITAAASGVQVVSAALLVTGVTPFSASLVVAIPYIAVLFAWLLAVGRAARRSGRWPRRLALTAELLGWAVVAALPVAGLAALLPAGSLAQYVVGAVAVVPGSLGFLGQPVWLLALSRWPAARD